ncbi:rod shape-determining protein MreD [Euzebya tangerina]|uniref:rod shape-determining protein MreD n=1 Tax=Euzebya tangerina TaxID=591198 RepID=UPI000E314458|nr:rod shape-determining protein MreD [Euzebya tangerina]
MPIRVVVFAGLILVALLLKTTLLPTFAFLSFRPDVLIVMVVAVALVEGADMGIKLGFAAGLAQDLISGQAALVGLGALVVMGAGYAAGRMKPYIAASERTGSIALCGALSGAGTLVAGLLGLMFGVIEPSLPRVLLATVVVGLYSALVSPLVLRPTRWLVKQFPPPSLASS